MTCTAAIMEFYELVREAEAADLREEPIEPYLVHLLSTIKRHPDCRAEYVVAFNDLITGTTSVPWELVPFCMHELRWDEVRLTIEASIAAARSRNDWRAIPIYAAYLDAFSEDWGSADLFQYYTPT